MSGRGEFAFAGAPAAARFAPSEGDLRFWAAACAIAVLLHAAVLTALLTYQPTPLVVQPGMVVELAPPVQTVEQSQRVQPAPEPPVRAAPPPPAPPIVQPEPKPEPPPVIAQPEPVPEPPPVIESRAEPVPPAPLPKPRPKQPEPAQPKVAAPPEPVRDPDFSAWSALQRPAPPPQQQQQAVQRPVTQAPNEYYTRIHALLERHKVYPRAARARGIEGSVYLMFTLDKHGYIVSHRILRSSGSDILDRAVHELMERASPLPPFPPGMQGNELELTMTVNFHLRP